VAHRSLHFTCFIRLLFCLRIYCWPAAICLSQDGDSSQVHGHTEPPCRGTEGEAASDYEDCFWARRRECAQERWAVEIDVERWAYSEADYDHTQGDKDVEEFRPN